MTEYSAFPRIEGLVDLACRNGVDVRPTLLRVLTDLYIQTRTHTSDEEAQYVELALRLIDSVDAATRATIAIRLAGYPRAPAAILRRLEELGVASAPTVPADAPAIEPDLRDSFFAAGSYERQMMLTNLDAGGTPRRAPVAVETCKRLEAAVLAGNTSEFVRLIESTLLVPRAIADKIAHDDSGEPIVIAAKALGMTRAALQRILLLLNPKIGHSVARVYELAALYDEISEATADSMVDIWRGRAPRRRTVHQPALYDDEKRSARAATTTSRHQSHRRSDALAARFRNSGR